MLVNVKIASNKRWQDTEGKNLLFETREQAFTFAHALAYMLSGQVRLDFEDMTGKCNGNGHYVDFSNYKQVEERFTDTPPYELYSYELSHESLPKYFDAYEVHGMKVRNEFGETYEEQCEEGEEPEFWCLFGHLNTGGLDSIGNFDTEAQAYEILSYINPKK